LSVSCLRKNISHFSKIFGTHCLSILFTFSKDNLDLITFELLKNNTEFESINSEISLIILYSKNKMIDIYFYTKKDLSINLKDDILEYISLFNDIKQY
jgi:hypothetical protein